MHLKRIGGVDLLRGSAIFIMIIANSCPYLLREPYPLPFRMLNSLAAPLFIFLSGFSLVYSYKLKSSSLEKSKQVFYLFCSAAILDLAIWKIQPFQTFDVLYLIATGMAVNLLFVRISPYYSYFFIFLLAVFPQIIDMPYRFEMEEKKISNILGGSASPYPLLEWKRYLIDGWFPVMPWLLFAVAGGLWARNFDQMRLKRNQTLRISLLSFIFFSVILLYQKENQNLRNGYLELFYPAGTIYVLAALSFVLAAFSAIKYHFQSANVLCRILRLLGRNSLLLYLSHAAIISYVFSVFFEPGGLFFFILMISLFIVLMVMIAYAAQKSKALGYLNGFPSSIRSILGLRG